MDTKLTDFKLLFSAMKAPAIAKLAIISSDSNIIPTWLAIASFFLSQLQILSVLVKTALFCSSSTSLQFSHTLSIVHKVISVGDFLDFVSSPVFSYTALTVIFAYLTFTLFLLVFLLKTLHSNKLHINLIQRAWNIISYAHTLLFFYPIHTILLNTINLAFAQDQRTLFSTHEARRFIQVYSCMSFALNIFFAAITLTFLYPPVKLKFALSSKTKVMGIISISHKLVLPLLWMVQIHSDAFKVFLLALNLIICLLRDGLFFRMLPYYNVTVLRIASSIFPSLTLLTLVSLVCKLASYGNFHESLIIMFTAWLLLTPMTIKIYQSCLKRICHRILFKTSRLTNLYHLIHYWPLYKTLSKERADLKVESKNLNRGYFLYTGFMERAAKRSLELNKREEDRVWSTLVLQKKGGNVFESSQCVLSLFIMLLRLSARKNPLMILPKLWLAFARLKYERSCLAVNQVIQEAVQGSPSIIKTISFGLLQLKMLRKLQSSQAEKAPDADKGEASSNLNMQDFLQVKQRFQKLTGEIKGQLTTQSKFWKDFQNHVPDYDSLMDLVKQTQVKIKTIQKYVKDAHSLTRPNFFEPILILGLYLCFIQSEFEQGQKFLREYDRLSLKNRIQSLAMAAANKRNSEKNSLYFVLSLNSKDMGKIISHAKNINQLLLMQGDSAVGRHINIFAASQAESRPGSILGASLQDPRVFESPIEVRLINAEGYLMLYLMSITLNFLPKTGLCVCVLLKPSEDTNKAVLINQNGDILQYSEGIEDDLEFNHQEGVLNMFSLCPHLSIIVQAFRNVSELKSRNHHMEINGVAEKDGGFQRLYEKYSKGDTLIFNPTTCKNQESVNSLTVVDFREEVTAKPEAYLATVQLCAAENDEIFLVKLKEKIAENPLEVYANLDPALKAKGMKASIDQQITPSSGISSKNHDKVMSTKMTNHALGSNQTGSKPSLHNIDAQLEEIKEMETEEANHAYARSSCHVPSSVDIPVTDRYNNLLQKEYNYEDHMVNKTRGKEVSITQLSSERKIIKLSKTIPDNKSQSPLKDPKRDLDSNIARRRSVKRKPSATQTASKILQSEKGSPIKGNGHDKQSNGGSSVSSQLNRNTRPEKIIRNILTTRRHSKTTIIYASYFLCVVTSLLGFLLWFSMNASTVSHTVSAVSDVLQNLYFRCHWTNVANQETRLWVGVKGGIATEFTNLEIQLETTNLTFHKMAEFNNKLRDSVSQLDHNLQLMFSEKNVRVYDRDDDHNLVYVDTTDTFRITTQMLNLGFINVYTPLIEGEIYDDYINKESRFIFDNSFDDLLIENEHLITVLKDKVYNTFTDSEMINGAIVAVAIVISLLFMMASGAYIWSINKDTYRFTTILFTLPHEDADLIEQTLFAFQDMLDKEHEGFDCLEALDDVKIMNRARANSQKLAEKREKVKQTQSSRQANLNKYNRRNWLLFLKSITIQLVIFGLLIFFYTWSLNRIKILKQQQVIINTSLESVNLQTVISVELQAMSMDNSTTTIRHTEILPTLQTDVSKLSQLTELEKNMRNEKGQLPDAQKAILINYDCKEARSPLYFLSGDIVEKECKDLSSGTGYTGLLKLLADMTNQLVDYLTRFNESVKDEETLAKMYIESVMNIMGYIDVTTALFLLSYSATHSDFVNSVNDLLAEGPILSIVAAVVVPILGLWSWFYVIRWLAKKEFDKKEMLELVPPKMILSNRHIKHYVFRIASSKEKGQSLLT